ncbi:MAG: 4-hydroxy-3-methylbut-2-enyl diphosphate reductase [Candidatus Zixiibacteriota bacterium]|nr:MAG: 4-hydroxy-3-methylbut-2-enyl diphosphate reductase [candidate division Zixibacteria bacterium]
MKAVIDPRAGFCGGVKRAIHVAEDVLARGGSLAVKGELIHNRLEMERLGRLGLEIVDEAQATGGKPILVRTHGEEAAFFERAAASGAEVVDATCPKVLRSQKVIRRAHEEGRQIVIVGHVNHPEVVALQGHCDGRALVVKREEQIPAALDPSQPTLLIAQTTVAPEVFVDWQERLTGLIPDLQIFDSRCSFVTRRQQELVTFAAEHPAIVFVGGRNSSNTALLYNVCRQANPRTYFVENETELDPAWFKSIDRVGISGSASTPMWLLQKVAEAVETLVAA